MPLFLSKFFRSYRRRLTPLGAVWWDGRHAPWRTDAEGRPLFMDRRRPRIVERRERWREAA